MPAATLLLAALLSSPADAGRPAVAVHGEVRTRAELHSEADLDRAAAPVAADGEQVLLRSRLTVEADAPGGLRLVVQAQDSRLFGQEPTTTSHLGNLGLHQAYLEAGLGCLPVALQVGRFPLVYGDQRLLGGLEWSNTARAFDGVRVRGTALGGLSVDAFWARLHADAAGERGLGDDLLGVYAWWHDELLTVDLYGLYLRDGGGKVDADGDGQPEADRLPGGGDADIVTVGVRADANPLPGVAAGVEVAYQLGTRGQLDVAAWAAHAALAYTLPLPVSPKLELGWDRASGDADAADGTWGTFENLFPTNHMHYGFADLAAWKNVQDLWAGIGAQPAPGLSLLVRGHVLSRVEAGDTFYRASGAALRPRASAAATDALPVGKELDLLAKWKAADGLGLLAGWSVLLSDAFLDETDAGGDAPNPQLGYVQVTGSF